MSMLDRWRASPLKTQLLRFFISTLIGLAVDLGVYSALVALGVYPGVANVVSAGLAVCAMFVLSSRFVFATRGNTVRLLAFVSWYVVSIVAFSLAIQYMVMELLLLPLWAKVLTLPLSFLANFAASRFIFVRRREVATDVE